MIQWVHCIINTHEQDKSVKLLENPVVNTDGTFWYQKTGENRIEDHL